MRQAQAGKREARKIAQQESKGVGLRGVKDDRTWSGVATSLTRSLFLVRLFNGVENSVGPLDMNLDFEDLIQQAADICPGLFGLGAKSFDELCRRTNPLGCLGDGIFYFSECF